MIRPAHVFGYTGAWVLVVVLFAIWCGLGVIMGHHGMAPDLPRVNEAVWLPRANPQNAMLVAVAHDGKIFCGNNQVLPEQLEDCLRQQLSRGSERKVYIRADARARYRNVEAALDGIRAAGIEDIAFLVESRKPKTDPLQRW